MAKPGGPTVRGGSLRVVKLTAIAFVAVACVLTACSRGGSNAGSPAPKSATERLGCDFEVPNPLTKDRQLTQASIDSAVEKAPAAIRADLRTIYELTKRFRAEAKAAQAAPESERASRLQEASKTVNNPQYKGATERLRTYFTQHCTGLQRRTPTSSP